MYHLGSNLNLVQTQLADLTHGCCGAGIATAVTQFLLKCEFLSDSDDVKDPDYPKARDLGCLDNNIDAYSLGVAWLFRVEKQLFFRTLSST